MPLIFIAGFCIGVWIYQASEETNYVAILAAKPIAQVLLLDVIAGYN
jgi:hypothetical protein